MYRAGGWWKWAIGALALAGCLARTEPGSSGGEAGRGDEDDTGSGGGQVPAGTGGKVGHGGKIGSGGKVGHGGKAGSGGNATSGTGGTAPGGSGPSGGSAGHGESCSDAPACGGDVTGTWTVASACLDATGSMDVSALGLGCNVAAITGSRAVAGTLITNADGTYLDRTTTSGEDQIMLAPECLNISGVVVRCERLAPVVTAMGYDAVTCAPADGGSCRCDAVFSHASGLGVLTWEALESGSFTTTGSTLTLDDGYSEPRSYRYCASAGRLELLPLSTFTGTLRGSVVLAEP